MGDVLKIGVPVTVFQSKKEEENDLSYLAAVENGTVDNAMLYKFAEMLDVLKRKYEAARYEADCLEAEYNMWRKDKLPEMMEMLGYESVKTSGGIELKINKKFSIKPNKNYEDQKALASWLSSVGGEALVKNEIATSWNAELLDALIQCDIPYEERAEINSTKLRAFIAKALDDKNGKPVITKEDIPACVHYYEWKEAVIND